MEEDYFYKYIEALDKTYEKDPVKAVKLLSDSVSRVKREKSFLSNLGLDHKKLEIVFLVILSLAIALLGLLNVNGIIEYLGGFIFFIAGLLVAFYAPGVGIIGLFSHGCTGFYLMNVYVIDLLKESPVMSDPSNNMTSYFWGIGIVLFIAFFLTLIHNFIKPIKEIKYIKAIILLLYFIGILLIQLIPRKFGL
jgi:hypothetical protein